MTKTYSLEGLHCGSCTARVEKALSGLGGVLSATVTLDKASIETADEIPLKQLQEAIGKVGMYSISEYESSN
ncbi:hypothetical protein MASR2M18_21000 [Ignavibacteria bacterium]|nr:heavy-metal-associated domain-containing protein [Bacteroidota bacterium]MCZ2131992.1 heavy-metal-associated domain-containing protein [Bacteroidota bacterium]